MSPLKTTAPHPGPDAKGHDASAAGIAVGLGAGATPATVAAFAEAGASEFFFGFVPEAWWSRYGLEASPNRRHRAENQFLSRDSLAPVLAAAREHGVATFLTLNEHVLDAQEGPLFDDIVSVAMELGAEGVVLSALEHGPRFRERFPSLRLIASGDAPVYNSGSLRLAARMGFERITFSRETDLADMEALTSIGAPLGLDFEAFLLGEWCVYNGALCFTCHGYGTDSDFCTAHSVRLVLDTGARQAGLDRPAEEPRARERAREAVRPELRAFLGGCNLCGLGDFFAAGVRTFKIPGRSVEAVEAVRLVRGLLDAGDLSPEACRRVIDDPGFCDGSNCRLDHPVDGQGPGGAR